MEQVLHIKKKTAKYNVGGNVCEYTLLYLIIITKYHTNIVLLCLSYYLICTLNTANIIAIVSKVITKNSLMTYLNFTNVFFFSPGSIS